MLDDAFTWSEQQFNVKGAANRQLGKGKITSQVADVTRWIPLFGITQQITYERVALITSSLAISSVVLLAIIILVVKFHHPSGVELLHAQ